MAAINLSLVDGFSLSDELPFTPGSSGWLPGWLYRKKITVDNTKIDANLTDFPVAVILTSSNFDFSKARSDGYDIRFTRSGGLNLLKYERERHDSANLKAEYHIKAPFVFGAIDTDFYIYSGKSDAADGADPTAVWDSNFGGVWHLKEDPSGTAPQMLDSTANDNDGTSHNAMTSGDSVDAKIGKGLDFDGIDDAIKIPHSTSTNLFDNFTAEAWIKIPSGTTQTPKGIFNKFYTYPPVWTYQGWAIILDTDTNKFGVMRGNGTWANSGYHYPTQTYTLTNWHHVVLRRESGTMTLYVDGLATDLSVGLGMTTHAQRAAIGCQYGTGDTAPADPSGFLNGIIDEVRLSAVVRSAAWVKATYNSGNGTLVNYGVGEIYEALTDAHSLADAFLRVPFIQTFLTDAHSLADAFLRVPFIRTFLTDAYSFADVMAKRGTYYRTLTDAYGLADIISTLRSRRLTLIDAHSLADAFLRVPFIQTFLTDAYSFADVMAKRGTYYRTLTDAYALADPITALRAKLLVLADAYSLADVATLLRARIVSLLDAYGYGEVLSTQEAYYRTLTDAYSLADALSTLRSRRLVLADAHALADLLSTLRARRLTLADGHYLADLTSFQEVYYRTLTDAHSLADILGRQEVYYRFLTDAYTLADAWYKIAFIQTFLTDAYSLADMRSLIKNPIMLQRLISKLIQLIDLQGGG